MKLPKLLKKPELPQSMPIHSKWLAGEGAGSWFVFEKKDNKINVQRFSPKGNFECENSYVHPKGLNLNIDFTIGYPSHCSVVTVHQNDKKYRLEVQS